jgi:chorismate dehydratase
MTHRLPQRLAPPFREGHGRPRVGAVQYLNTRPLVHGLAGSGVTLSYDLPSRLADQLAGGQLDVALIPSIELFRGDRYRVVSDACIGCRGPVMSVKLFFRTAPERVQSLAVDEGSRTSAALARLLIGDRALAPPAGAASFQVIWDLGDEWCRWTGLPFVFAVWAARADLDSRSIESIESLLARARDTGRSNLAAIAAAEATGHGLTVPQCLSYLRDNLHYELGAGEREALSLFHALAAKLSLAPTDLDLAASLSTAPVAR